MLIDNIFPESLYEYYMYQHETSYKQYIYYYIIGSLYKKYLHPVIYIAPVQKPRTNSIVSSTPESTSILQ